MRRTIRCGGVTDLKSSAEDRGLSRRNWMQWLAGTALASFAGACSTDPGDATGFPAWSGGPLHYAGLLDVARRIRNRELSPVELTGMILDRISQLEPKLKSYATVMADAAQSAARRAETEILAGRYRGPLHGIPVAVKDLCFTRGTRTMAGMQVHRDFVPGYDATVVGRLEAAGAILLGKLNLTEGAMAGYHPDFEIPVNPWGDDLWVGASSSGSGVATAAGLCFAALGSDTGGSIRFPAMANGTVGLKPTYGRVSRYGVFPLAESLDHVGPMARRVGDAAAVLQVIAGQDPRDPTSLDAQVPDYLAGLHAGVRDLRIGYDRSAATRGVDAELVTAVEGALETLQELGARLIDISLPEFTDEIGNSWFTICAAEALAAHQATFPARSGEYGRYLREILEQGAAVTSESLQAASRQRADFSRHYQEVLENVDALLTPGGGVPFRLDPKLQYQGAAELDPAVVSQVYTQFTFPADLSGVPTLSLPCGISPLKVPFTLQLTGRRLSEPMLCRIGQAYESATGWHELHPPL